MNRTLIATVKLASLLFGTVLVLYGTGCLYDWLTEDIRSGVASVSEVFVAVALVSVILAGGALMAALPQSARLRFRRPEKIETPRRVYGFGTVLAVGVGATLGSPLFILIPQNVIQYLLVSVGSLCVATVLSVLMAKVYANMYSEASKRGMDAVGGPSFARIAAGTRSVRYFITRISMWIANTALAAYCIIVFLIFDFSYLPGVLTSVGLSGAVAHSAVLVIAGALVLWTGLNLLFERNLLRATGVIQIVLSSALVGILVVHSYLLGSTGSWELGGIVNLAGVGSWPVALVINTAYLYLLFFGFQEIQALEKDSLEYSSIPVVSWVRRGYRMGRSRYLGVAMILAVLIASAVNIFYALAVFAAHPDPGTIRAAQIPALYLASTFLGPSQGLWISVAFLIATVTTFVPAFLAATRHFSALGDDGYIPRSMKNTAWVFTLASIFFLAAGNQSFLVEITDFMVLISLGVIVLSSVWLRRARAEPVGRDYLPFVVSGTCFVAAAAVYVLDSSVVVFGILSILFAYLIFDVLELGTTGTRIFLSIFGPACLSLLALFSVGSLSVGGFLTALSLSGSEAYEVLVVMLTSGPLLLIANVYADASIGSAVQGRRAGPDRR